MREGSRTGAFPSIYIGFWSFNPLMSWDSSRFVLLILVGFIERPEFLLRPHPNYTGAGAAVASRVTIVFEVTFTP